jgi:hypothetical protein
VAGLGGTCEGTPVQRSGHPSRRAGAGDGRGCHFFGFPKTNLFANVRPRHRHEKRARLGRPRRCKRQNSCLSSWQHSA